MRRVMRKRASLADDAKAEAGVSEFQVTEGVRGRMLLDQIRDPGMQGLQEKQPGLFRKSAVDDVLERQVKEETTGSEVWVPVVPHGLAVGHMSWRRWVFLQIHVGVFGGHRLLDQTMRILGRLAWWPGMRKDVADWIEKRMTCIRFRRRPTKQDAVAVKPLDANCWEEVMVDMEGPSNPADKAGNRYVMTYICCLCHALFLEPCRDLTYAEVRRAFARCVFRSGTLPLVLRSDRGIEFKSLLMTEFVALLGVRHRFGTAWRPMEQGIVERSHQETQKILGMLLTDVLRSYRAEWTELLVVVEFLVYTTPGPHGYAPRDLDRRWSLAVPLEKELQAFQVLDFEPVSEYARKLFREYRDLRAKVTGWYAATSMRRAELANRWRKATSLEPGDKVVYRDPRAKAVGGRTPWKEPLSDPCIVEAVRGNRARLRRLDGTIVEEAHLEDVVVVPEEATNIERTPLEFQEGGGDPDREDDRRRSPGQMMSESSPEAESSELRRRGGKLDKLSVGQYVAYDAGLPGKVCKIGRVVAIIRAEAEVAVHKHRPVTDGRLRVKWVPLFVTSPEEGGQEREGVEGRPSVENVAVKCVLATVQLHDSVMSHAAARRLDRAGWRLDKGSARVDLAALPTAEPESGIARKLETLAAGSRMSIVVGRQSRRRPRRSCSSTSWRTCRNGSKRGTLIFWRSFAAKGGSLRKFGKWVCVQEKESTIA